MGNDSNIAVNPLAVLKPEKEQRRYTLAEYLRRKERAEELHAQQIVYLHALNISVYPDGLVISETPQYSTDFTAFLNTQSPLCAHRL